MIKHPLIRKAVLDALKLGITDPQVTWYDGRPGFLDTGDLPAVAVYLTDAQYTGESLDENTWQATLHIEVFLKAISPDSALDVWMESNIFPVMSQIPALNSLVETCTPEGYDYQRDDEAMTWGSADLKYSLTYTL
ncbi:phage minor tail U family protein [Yersinia intermedia]|uniref:phage minor tail U family protein n=1 Tax=Yersinia intermedia TaxID=631 RepID=UPI0022FE1B4E|nr:phage minor tail U family protein [Yersinia intermedia]MDA5480873.1 phage minor tail U family protein [Yersinia intermedia]